MQLLQLQLSGLGIGEGFLVCFSVGFPPPKPTDCKDFHYCRAHFSSSFIPETLLTY